MGNPAGPHRSGVDRAKIALGDAIRVYVWQHLGKYPGRWFTAVELARVIREQYVCDPVPLGAGRYRYGRTNVTMSALRQLRDAGDVTSRPHPDRRDATQWAIAPAGEVAGHAA